MASGHAWWPVALVFQPHGVRGSGPAHRASSRVALGGPGPRGGRLCRSGRFGAPFGGRSASTPHVGAVGRLRAARGGRGRERVSCGTGTRALAVVCRALSSAWTVRVELAGDAFRARGRRWQRGLVVGLPPPFGPDPAPDHLD